MKIGVLVKQVPDTESRIKLAGDSKSIDESTIRWIVNPFDEYAIEEALRLKEKAGGTVVVITAGPERATEAIRTALAMGVDSGIRLDTSGVLLDSFTTAKILAKTISDESLDIVFAGKQAVDDDCAQVVQSIAVELDWAEVPVIEKFELEGQRAIVQMSVGAGVKEVLEVALPAIFGCEKDLNKPRYATLPNIMKARSKPIIVKSAREVIGSDVAKTDVVRFIMPPERIAGRIISGAADVVADEIVGFLRDEVKVIQGAK